MGCPGRGPVGRPLPGTVPGIGPRFPPVGIGGRGGAGGRCVGVARPAAGRAAIGWEPAGAVGRRAGGAPCDGRAAIGCPGVAPCRGPGAGTVGLGAAGAGADGAGAAGFAGAAVPAAGATGGAAGLAAGTAGVGVAAGAVGAGFGAAGNGAAGATAGAWAAGA